MSISSINYGSSILGQSVRNISDQLADLSTQLSTGLKSTTYAGMGVNEGFAIAARAQLSNISAFGNTITNVNTIIQAANTALQSLQSTASSVQSAAAATPQNLNSTGQTIAQQNASAQLSSIVGILNTQVGDRYIFSGSAINTQAVASSDDIMNGTATKAGLKQVIAERQQADLGTSGLGRLVVTQPTTTSVQVAEDVAGSPFGFKLSSVSSTLTGATISGPSGSPPAISVDLGATNPNPGDQLTFTFNLPDGSQESVKLTATTTSPAPSGSFTIGGSSTATAGNISAALTNSITTLANTALVAASAVAAGDNFFNTDSTATGTVANNKLTTPAPITGATLLSGGANTDSLSASFATGDTITVNGQQITFVASGAHGNNQVNVTDSVQTLLSKIDALSGTSNPSTVSGGVVTLRTDNAANFSVTSSNTAALGALGFSGPVSATQPPLRVGSPFGSATKLVNGSANTVAWYTGNSGPGSARASSTVRVDQSQTVQFGAQANEQAIRSMIQSIAVFAAVTTPPTGTNSGAQIAALSSRTAANLTPQAGQQTISNIQTDFANAQNTMKDVSARQTQTLSALQNMISQTEGIDQNQVASELLALQTSLQASYQTTAMLSQLSLTKFLPVA
ncbi:flagellar protein [Bradyrhizobium sp. NP1]|uniref:flagellar protein n=1 Tax=Bradyrhizobium sp. NP1 TaxID=3049772 RepID=UPI0025A62FAF|nr:flagellar protein [Bradyrhizobium sp. NP1]WJR76236.1 flagellar protein [Bradyrhizobium sp. NP1]